jgi:hypothetical protein
MDSKLQVQMFEKVLQSAIEGCHKIHQQMMDYVREKTLDRLETRGTGQLVTDM